MAAGEPAPNPFDCEEGGNVFLDDTGRGECPVCWAAKGREDGKGVIKGREGAGNEAGGQGRREG